MARPSWLGRAVRNSHRHAVEQASRRGVEDDAKVQHERAVNFDFHTGDPMYVTDLWFVVKEGESEVRIPACSAILRVTCSLVRDLPEAGDVPVLGDHKRLGETQRHTHSHDYDSDDQEFISGIDEHLTRATEDLHKVTEYLLTKP